MTDEWDKMRRAAHEFRGIEMEREPEDLYELRKLCESLLAASIANLVLAIACLCFLVYLAWP